MTRVSRPHPGDVSIRDARRGDLETLRVVFRDASLSNEGDRDALLAHPDALEFTGAHIAAGHTRVAVEAGAVVGFATAVPGPGGAWELEDLFVAPARMRRGIGAALVEDAVARAASGGGERIEVVANDHASAFYASRGFTGGERVVTELGVGMRLVRHLRRAGARCRRPPPR